MSIESVARISAELTPRNPVTVVRGYARRADAGVRLNAVAALGALGDDDAIDALLDMALAEADPGVLGSAEDTLVALDRASPEAVRKRLEARLGANPPNLQALIGRLRLRGLDWNDAGVIRILVDLASVPSPLQEDAEELLASLTGADAQLVVDELAQRLKTAEPTTRLSTYALLGRMRARGASAGDPRQYRQRSYRLNPRSLWARLTDRALLVSLAAGFARDPAAAANRKLTPSFAWLVIVVSGTVAISVATLLSQTMIPEAPRIFYPVLLLTAPSVALALAIVTTRRTTPLSLHFDLLAAAIGEAVWSAFWALGPALVSFAVLLVLVQFTGSPRQWIALLILGTCTIVALVFAVRIGTAVSYGAVVQPDGMVGLSTRTEGGPTRSWFWQWASSGRAFNALAQGLSGTGGGIVVLGGLLLIARRYGSLVPGSPVARMVEALWVFLLPTAAGLAAAFAAIDWASPHRRALPSPLTAGGLPERDTVGRVRFFGRPTVALLCSLLLMALTILVTVAGVVKPPSPVATPDIADSGKTLSLTKPLASAPIVVDFRIGFLQRVRFEVPPPTEQLTTPGDDPLTLTLYEWQGAARNPMDDLPGCTGRHTRRPVRTAASPALIEEWLGWGCYSVEVQPLATDSQTKLTASLADALDIRSQQGLAEAQPDAPALLGATFVRTLRADLNLHMDRLQLLTSSKLQAVGSASVRFLSTLPAEQIIEVDQPTFLIAKATPSSDSAGPADTMPSAPSSGARSKPATTKGSEFLLWLDDEAKESADGSATLEAKLEARQAYRLHLDRYEGTLQSRLVALNVLLVRPGFELKSTLPSTVPPFEPSTVPVAESGQTLEGYWRIETLPARVDFVAKFPQIVDATTVISTFVLPERPTVSLPRSFRGAATDVQLELRQGSKVINTSDDDPERITKSVAPGRYQLEVKRLADATDAPVLLELRLNTDKALAESVAPPLRRAR